MSDAIRKRGPLIALGSDLPEGGAGVRFEVDGVNGQLPAFAIRWHGRVHAYVNACPHQRSELDWTPGVFFDADSSYLVCATHGALFEPDSGYCVTGPCVGGALTKVGVEEDETRVVLAAARSGVNEADG
jgi:nitrite reductase/ring-hydroxylating ferredoxin subunit